MFWSDDPHRDFDRYQTMLERKQDKLPRCAECDEPITDEECYAFDRKTFHSECLNNNYKIRTEDYCRKIF